jgi:hypothetical protein
MVAAGACLGIVAQADEIQFTTLPETVQTSATFGASPASKLKAHKPIKISFISFVSAAQWRAAY